MCECARVCYAVIWILWVKVLCRIMIGIRNPNTQTNLIFFFLGFILSLVIHFSPPFYSVSLWVFFSLYAHLLLLLLWIVEYHSCHLANCSTEPFPHWENTALFSFFISFVLLKLIYWLLLLLLLLLRSEPFTINTFFMCLNLSNEITESKKSPI